MRWFVSHVIYLSLTKPTMQQRFHPSAKHLLYKYIAPSFVEHSFYVKGETWHFCANSSLLHFDIISNIFVSLCKYSRTFRVKPLTWCRVVSQAGLFGSGRARA